MTRSPGSRRSRASLFLAVNGLDGGAIYAGLTPTRNDLSDELGTTGDTIVVGLVTALCSVVLNSCLVVNTGGYRVVSIDFQAPAHTVAVTSEVHQGNYAPNVLSLKERTFEVGLKGSATFDVTKIDKSPLFVATSGTPQLAASLQSSSPMRTRTGSRTQSIKVQTSVAVRTDTTRLKITGRTTTGDDFDGSRAVTMTSQTWQSPTGRARAATSLAVRCYYTYTKGLKRTWW